MEENRKLARRMIEQVWNKRDLQAIDEFVAPNYVLHDPSSPDFGRGPEACKRHVGLYTAAFPDTHFVIDSMIAEGDQVVTRWTVHATHRGRLNDIPATGRPVTVTGITVSRIANGKLQEDWVSWDALGLMRQLGAARPMTQAAG